MNPNLNKIAYNTEEEARQALIHILYTQHRPWAKRDIKPCRTYYDAELDKWFLTSKPTVEVY
jgi:hypothetical protein